MSEWKEYKLVEIINDVAMGPFGSNLKVDNFISSGVPVIRGGNLNNGGFEDKNFVFVAEEKAKSLKRSLAYPDDLVFTHRGTIGQVGIIEKTKYPYYLVSQSQLRLTVNKQFLSPRYLYYWFKSKTGQYELLKNSAQVGVPAIASPTKSLKEIDIKIPDLPTQTAIAEILSSLDDKIELNNKINQELENLVQTFFKQWFIDFEFPNENGEPYKSSGGEMVDSELGEIPKGWGVKRLENLAKISLGGTPSRNNGGYWNGNIPWVNSGAINENYILSPTELITQEGLDNSSSKLIPKHSTLIAITGATLGQVSYSLIDACYNQSVISLTPPDNTKEFIHLLVNTIIQELIKHQTGGAQQHINKGNVETFKVIFPTEELLKRFKEILTDLYLKIECNLKENQQLTNLRDSLLPKLISGELEINELPN